MSPNHYEDKQALIRRFNRIKGQIEAIARMIEEDKSCYDVFNQIKAVKSALNSASEEFLKSHLNQCFLDDSDERDRIINMIFKN